LPVPGGLVADDRNGWLVIAADPPNVSRGGYILGWRENIVNIRHKSCQVERSTRWLSS